ncbi:hypothetical protein BCR34DRAFT_592200 [Clohesyomyces aquaticus]|uniref:chitinase n=1 Tax=Clohesyomyces aquaticus TaxID=1231657 RepID=A0A1Y1YUQ2_9PLEO|nr:hypothetical protein BCR34DRAFT_592200 [Clohesyomyces aquaticus]
MSVAENLGIVERRTTSVPRTVGVKAIAPSRARQAAIITEMFVTWSLGSLTRLNLAFAYIERNTFHIVPMPGVGEKTISQITNLKQKAPGLKIWISLGGWTFSDNDTDTQAVWGDLASTPLKRENFAVNVYKLCKQWGFDGVDLDWEYPGAPDRGRHPEDGENYVALLEEINVYFQASESNFGLSFTAPTSYWHGSWGSPQDQIGSFVYAHTNKSEIEDSLNLFWRNGVPANKINLGIGFYGRSYTLEDANCNTPGCPFSQPEAEIKYMAWGENQWVSYYDPETLQKKVEYANKQGLLELFIWAIDLGDTKHSALQALLGGKLATFNRRNGYDPANNGSFRNTTTGNQCSWCDCGTESCSTGMVSIGAQQYCGMNGNDPQRQTICCPFDAAPKECRWAGNQSLEYFCTSSCDNDEIPVVSSVDAYIGDSPSHQHCFSGFAQYFCKAKQAAGDVCAWTDKCVDQKDESVCPDGRSFVTTRQADCKFPNGYAFCCDKDMDTSSCYWNERKTDGTHFACSDSETCGTGESLVGMDEHGGKDKNGNTHERQYELDTGDPWSTWKYSNLTESVNHTHLHHRLEKRGLSHAPVYDFTFDYDFEPIAKRDQSNVLVRIDYSDDPGYWDTIVEAHHDKKKRDLEVKREFGGDHVKWLELTWRKDKRSLDKDKLHKRWWSGDVIQWWDKQKQIDEDYTGIRHRVYDTFRVNIFDQDLACPEFGSTAASVTVIGTLGNLNSFEESSAWFHTSGSIDAKLHFNAKGKMSFHTGQVEVFGAHNFGASFRVPGIVTIGPDFRVNFANWDYAKRYPVPSGKKAGPEEMGDHDEATVDTQSDPFNWDLDAEGQPTAHIIPKVTFGIVFDSSAISNAALGVGVDAYTRLYADLNVGQNKPLVYCYGMHGGAKLFANVEAPTIFGKDFSQEYPLKPGPYQYDLIPRKCSDGST